MLYNLLSLPTYLIDKLEPLAKWATIALLGVLIIASILLFIFKKQKAISVVKKLLLYFTLYCIILAISLLVLEIIKKYSLSYLEDNYVEKDIIYFVFIPLLVTLTISLAGIITLYVVSKKKLAIFDKLLITFALVVFCLIVLCVVLIYVYYNKHIISNEYYQDYGELNNLALYLATAILIGSSICLALVLGKNSSSKFDSRCIAFAGICLSLSFALSYVKLFELPYGGSITLFSMFPIMLFAYIYGIKKGLIVGLLYGILQAIQDPFIIHPAQFILDYPLAFAFVGFAGCLSNFKVLDNKPAIKFTISAIIGGFARYVCHVLSGVFAFGAYAKDAISDGEGIFSILAPSTNAVLNHFIYSLTYNSFIILDVILVIVAGILLFSSKSFNKEVSRIKSSLI